MQILHDCVAVFTQALIWFFLPSFYHQCHPHDKVSQALPLQIFTSASSMVIHVIIAQGGESLRGNDVTQALILILLCINNSLLARAEFLYT